MTTQELEPTITEDLVIETVALAWETFFGVAPDADPAMTVDEPMVCASIALAGPRLTMVVLRLTVDGSQRAASEMLGMEPDEMSDDDLADVVGELVNIIGGNLKGVVGSSEDGWSLSLPVVSRGNQTVPGSTEVMKVGFSWDGDPILCTILEHA